MSPIFWITKISLLRSIRSKFSFFVLIILFCLNYFLPKTLANDGSIKSEVQVIMVWSLGVTLFLLSIYTLFLSSLMMRSDIIEKQAMVIDVTPASRWKVIIGKLLAVCIINLFLLSCCFFITYFNIHFRGVQLEQKFNDANELLKKEPANTNAKEIKREYFILANDILTSRLRLEEHFDVDELTDATIIQMKKNGKLEGSEREAREEVRRYFLRLKLFKAPVGQTSERPITFRKIPLPEKDQIYYTFSYHLYVGGKTDERIRGFWRVLLLKDGKDDQKLVTPVMDYPVDQQTDQRKSFRFPSGILSAGDQLQFIFFNQSQKDVYSYTTQKFYLLVPCENYLHNLLKSFLLIYFKLILISILGLFLSTFTGFSVSIFLGISYIFFSYLHELLDTLLNRLKVLTKIDRENYQFGMVDQFLANMAKLVVKIFPDFRYYAGDSLVEGLVISWSTVYWDFFFNLLLRGGVLLFLAFLVFHLIEIGKATEND